MQTTANVGMTSGWPLRPEHSVRLVIQDRTDLPEGERPKVRIKDIPLNQSFIIGEIQQGIWYRAWKWLRRQVRRNGTMSMLAIAMLAKQFSAQHGVSDEHLPLIMGAITSAVATSWKAELGTATHNFTVSTGNTVKTALYTSSATLGASTTAYSATNEITGTGYTAGGVVIANVTPTTSGTTAIFDWADAQWTTATFTANGCLTYNSSASNKAIFVVAFGGDQSVTAGTFTIQWPTADASNAIIRIA
jgi:hypothetical protein